MARGWESKSVESQVEDRENARKGSTRRLTAEEQARARERHNLALSLTALERELESTRAPARRSAIEQAIAQLRAALDQLKS
jgi:hypothetical protein